MAEIAVMATMFVAGAYKGLQQRKAKTREATAYLDASNRRMAAATRDVAEEERKKQAMRGRALAVTAASGGGVDTPTVVNLLGDLDAEGEYRMMSAMYMGQNEAAGLTYRAAAARREGEAAFTAGIINGITSAVSAGASMGAFGGPKPPVPSGASVGGVSGTSAAAGGRYLSPTGYSGLRPISR